MRDHVCKPEGHVSMSSFFLFAPFFLSLVLLPFRFPYDWKKSQVSFPFGDSSVLRPTFLPNKYPLFKHTIKWGMTLQNLQSTSNTSSSRSKDRVGRCLKFYLNWDLEEKTYVEKGRVKEKATYVLKRVCLDPILLV